jgi:hypothetical protein
MEYNYISVDNLDSEISIDDLNLLNNNLTQLTVTVPEIKKNNTKKNDLINKLEVNDDIDDDNNDNDNDINDNINNINNIDDDNIKIKNKSKTKTKSKSKKSDSDLNSDSDSDDEPKISLDMVKKMVIKWVNLDDKIKETNKTVKEMKDEKVQLEDKILTFMNNNEQEAIPVKDGKLEKKESVTKEPINEEYIKKSLIGQIEDISLIDKLTEIIMTNRAITKKYKLARIVNKEKKPKTTVKKQKN